MLYDYIEPSERAVACPNQDVVYGQSALALDREPVVVQVPGEHTHCTFQGDVSRCDPMAADGWP